MTGPRARLAPIALTAALLGVFAGCHEPEPMPLAPSATWLVEAPPAAAGNPFEMVLFVRTPAGHRVHAYALPELDGIDVVERRILPASLGGETSVHREAFIARTRGPGLYRWPTTEVQVSDEAGAVYALTLEGLDLDVPSVLGERTPPRRPRGYRAPPAAPFGGGFGLGFAAGATVMGTLGLLLRQRRRRGGGRANVRASDAGTHRYFGGSGRLGRRLVAARETTHADPDAAAAAAALALRHWAADRFLVATHADASEELRGAPPAAADAADWSAWLDRLAAIELARFGRPDEAERRDALARAIDAAIAFADAVDRPRSGTRGGREERPGSNTSEGPEDR